MKNDTQVALRQGPQVTTCERAQSLDKLLQTSFLVIAVRPRNAEDWQYTIPQHEVPMFKAMRRDLKITTVQRAEQAEFYLLAKLAA